MYDSGDWTQPNGPARGEGSNSQYTFAGKYTPTVSSNLTAPFRYLERIERREEVRNTICCILAQAPGVAFIYHFVFSTNQGEV